jgi:hypothetical protein
MKNSKIILLFLLAPVLLSFSFMDINAQSVSGSWSGSVSLVQITIWMGDFRREKRVDIAFTENEGTGTVIDNAKSNTGDTKCTGAGKAELQHLSINMRDSICNIHIESPPCNGTSSTYIAGERVPYGPEITDIVISEKPWRNPNVLSGTETTVIDLGGGYNTTTTITWSLVRGPLDAQLIVTPNAYDIWIPKGSPDELRKGSVMDISLNVRGRNGTSSSMKAVRFELRLSNTSREPGTTLNAPLNPSSNQLPDIRFLPHTIGESIVDDQYIEIPCNDGKTGTATIASYDGGGWTTLTAVAVLEGGFRIEGTLLAPGGIKEIPIPKRNSTSKIATAWLTANGNPGEMDDKETLAIKPGDGLTAYEEYRGVISMGQFLRLKPRVIELGVMVKRAEATLFAEGIRWFKNASGIDVIPFDETEIAADRRLNKNASYAHDFDQYVLKLENGPTARSAAGENQPTNLSYMIPRQSELVVINVGWIDQFYNLQYAAATADGVRMPYTRNEMLASTIAHELAHGVNVNHHGNPSLLPQNRTAYEDSHPPYHIFGTNGIEIPVQNWRYDAALGKRYFEIKGYVGETGNEESGDLSCIMAYTSMYNWSYRAGPGGSLNYYEVPLLLIGKKLCTTRTGVNDINSRPNSKYFGAAAVGNCLSQIKLRE